MSRHKRDLMALTQMTGLVYDADQARMNALRRRETALRAALAALNADRSARVRQALVEDIALRSGADHRWEGWIDGRRTTLNQELARVLVELSRARTTLTRSFGRDLATRDLLLQTTRKEGWTQTRRSEPET